MLCKICKQDGIMWPEGDCIGCRATVTGINKRNADFILKACLETLKITGPTADMFLRRAKRVADEARGY